ncbi:MAG: hypothetical protein A2754_02335 [Candidatus Magasanikbacteria bacterium RIFCSPHIGHO2_01_FULL_47_8]|uniref:RNA polymerase sigma-70 region 4 domain-containing protein n=1 Tax=Candidatus Magasanikbacteria bacterium RIFCSPHIGHO2_01_FULL_47_8 TaxID=1798673 RepID=A0A1F6MAY6_9BACT|nr:MAG: hypothetical protein A2754_02335 [Candidatus Magasanikbacteria bacterium RIFCSPHIGHO2_01_FULL_47_8]
MERENHHEYLKEAQGFDLGSAFERYRDNLIKAAEKLLKNHDIKNYQTVAPDLVQNAFLQLHRAETILPQKKRDLYGLLARSIQSAVEAYLTLEANPDPKHPKPYNIRASHLESIDKAKNISAPPDQDKINLEELINNVTNITDMQKRILIAHHIEGKSYQEISEEFGFTSHQAVHQHEERAVEKLRMNPKFKNLLNIHE